MIYPKCPKCPYGKDDGVIPSTVKKAWYCTGCKSYFVKIGDKYPPEQSIKQLVKLESEEELRWTAEEIEQSTDRAVAQFYAGLNGDDRRSLKSGHIDIHGDLRDGK